VWHDTSVPQSWQSLRPLWIEEPTTHKTTDGAMRRWRGEIAPVKIATGEHIPKSRDSSRTLLRLVRCHYVQADCTRLAGLVSLLAVSLLAKKFNLPVVPNVGDMGQVHQHLVIFNHVAMGHEALFLEHIPHLRKHFVTPAEVEGGHYLRAGPELRAI